MARRECVLWLLWAAISAVMCSAAATTDCPAVDGYVFYRMQEVLAAHTITALDAPGTPANLAALCDKTTPCNAFTTSGQLQIVPMVPHFSAIDGNDVETVNCDGTYVAFRSLSGLILPDGVNADTLRADGDKTFLDMQAALAAAAKVSNILKLRNIDPLDAAKIRKEDLDQAFNDAKTPRSQTDAKMGSYSNGDVMAALTYPVWDSRGANGTTYNYISPVKDQGSCGSCVAFAVTAAAETAVAVGSKSLSNTLDLSEQWLFFCNGMYAPTCSTGWTATSAINVVVRSSMPVEANYPYMGAYDCTLKSPPETRVNGTWTGMTYTDITLAKEHIRLYGSVTTYFTVYNDFFYWTATSPPYVANINSGLAGYHQVLTIGYNDTGSFWIAKNSWGTGWGDKGFFRISYSAGVGFMSGSGSNIMGLKWNPPYNPSPSPSPPPSPPPSPACGDGICSANETCTTCANDCGACAVCGDGVCSGGETCTTCLADCGKLLANGTRTCCGDGVCNAAAGENCVACSADCGICPTCNKNGICESDLGEKCLNGTVGCSDCGKCSGSYCGDRKCTYSRKGYSESCRVCPQDCGVCTALDGFCGDGVCSTSEDASGSCPRDCKPSKFGPVTLGVPSNGKNNNGNGNGNGNSDGRRLRRGRF